MVIYITITGCISDQSPGASTVSQVTHSYTGMITNLQVTNLQVIYLCRYEGVIIPPTSKERETKVKNRLGKEWKRDKKKDDRKRNSEIKSRA